jgi:hypothetical protein
MAPAIFREFPGSKVLLATISSQMSSDWADIGRDKWCISLAGKTPKIAFFVNTFLVSQTVYQIHLVEF